jgi:hypothetical protein
MLRRLRCRLGLHSWQNRRNPEGGMYRECRACLKQRNIPTSAGNLPFGS